MGDRTRSFLADRDIALDTVKLLRETMVPISVASSSGSPIFMASTFAFSRSTKASWRLSWTKMRDAAVQL